MKRSKLLLLSLVVFSIVFIGCKKMSKGWVVGQVTVTNALTGEPMEVGIGIEYHLLPLLGQAQEKSESIGKTDENGVLKFKHKVARRSTGHKLRITHPYYYAPAWLNEPLFTTRSVQVRGNNKVEVKLMPRFPIQINAVNSNCFDDTDTMWVSYQYGPESYQNTTRFAVGCADTVFGIGWNKDVTQNCVFDQVTLHVSTKKNGISNSFSETHNLQPSELTYITINY
ncbi:MAG: hypothetical protein Crog4KO_04460 [Crocinitomicaceae bacterium]